MNIDLEQMLIEAEKLCLQLKEVRHLPDDVTEILTGKPVEKQERRHFPGKVLDEGCGDHNEGRIESYAMVINSGENGNNCHTQILNRIYSPHVGKPVLVKNSTDQTDNVSPSDNVSDDEIEVLSEHTASAQNETESKEENTTTAINSEVNPEMFVSAVQTQPDEELVVLSTNDKAVF
jgi:hypothetical protein